MARPRDRQLLALLDEFGCTAEPGGKHWKIRTADGRLVGVWPLNGRTGGRGSRGTRNLVAQLRRAHR